MIGCDPTTQLQQGHPVQHRDRGPFADLPQTELACGTAKAVGPAANASLSFVTPSSPAAAAVAGSRAVRSLAFRV
jgi:hypothetical protein